MRFDIENKIFFQYHLTNFNNCVKIIDETITLEVCVKIILEKISNEDIQTIFECISQALEDDRQEALAYLKLRTYVSDPFLKWDLIYRNLMNAFGNDNIKCSVAKRGMWTILLLYDEHNKILFSFMRETRFNDIKNHSNFARPQYIQALVNLNAELQALQKQLSLFPNESKFSQTDLEKCLDELCAGFAGNVDTRNSQHVLIVFSDKNGIINSLKAYVLDRDLDIVFEQDWLDIVKPIMSSVPENVKHTEKVIVPTLKPKALDRIREKELVTIKEQEAQKNA